MAMQCNDLVNRPVVLLPKAGDDFGFFSPPAPPRFRTYFSVLPPMIQGLDALDHHPPFGIRLLCGRCTKYVAVDTR
jgi:hypothetical protein